MVRIVDSKIEDASRKFCLAIDKSGVPIEVAAWMFEPDEERWRLMLVSPSVGAKGPAAVYRAIQNWLANQRSDEKFFELDDIKVTTPRADIPLLHLARMVELVKPGPEEAPRFRQNWFDGHLIEDVILLWSRREKPLRKVG